MAWTGRVLEALVVHDEALYEVLPEARGRPLAELGAAAAANAVANRDDHLEVVVLDFARNLAIAFTSNYSELPNSCLAAGQLTVREDPLEVLVHRRHRDLEQLGDQRLREPDGLILEAALDARAAVLGLIEDDA